MAVIGAGLVLIKAAKFVGSSVVGPGRDELNQASAGTRRLCSALNVVDAVGHTGEAILALTTGGAYDLAALGYGGTKYVLGFGAGLLGMTTLGRALHRSGKLTISAAGISLVTGGVSRLLPAGSVASALGAAPAIAHGTAALVGTKNTLRYEGKI